MIALSGASDIDIVFTGLRPGEKLHESLFGEDEQPSSTPHAMIRSVRIPGLDPARLTDGVAPSPRVTSSAAVPPLPTNGRQTS